MLLLGSVQAGGLSPQEMFTFLEKLAMIVSENSFGADVCHRRHAGLYRHQLLLLPRQAVCLGAPPTIMLTIFTERE